MLANRFLPSLQTAATLCLLTIPSLSQQASAQTFNKTFQVSPDASEIEIINQSGSIKVTAARATNRVVLTAKYPSQGTSTPSIKAEQSPGGRVKVEVTGLTAVELEATVPATSKLDLLCYNCTITVANAAGAVRGRTTDGAILFTGFQSARVEAHSTTGNVNFNGAVLQGGSYSLKSFSGRVDATLSANADFILSACSFQAGIDLGGFPLKFSKQTAQIIEAKIGEGRAALALWTQEGSLHLHRQP